MWRLIIDQIQTIADGVQSIQADRYFSSLSSSGVWTNEQVENQSSSDQIDA